jgi:RimJ/RimL family protein N-acetyltransferase
MRRILETDRLRLREFGRDDLDDLAPMVADRDQMTFYPHARTRDEASAWIDRNLSFYRKQGYGFWVIETRAAASFAGYCGIRPLDLEGASEIEIGWHVRKTFWNQGIATEAAAAVRDLAFGRFAMARLVALIPPDHLASRRVAEKIGMRPGRHTVLEGYRAVIYTAAQGAALERLTRRSRCAPRRPGADRDRRRPR